MSGQFITWLMRIWFVATVGYLTTVSDKDFAREVASLVKSLEFLLIPMTQVLTSSQMSQYCLKKS